MDHYLFCLSCVFHLTVLLFCLSCVFHLTVLLFCLSCVFHLTVLLFCLSCVFHLTFLLFIVLSLLPTPFNFSYDSETCLNRTLSKPKTFLIQTEFTVPSIKCLCNLNLCKTKQLSKLNK